MADISKDELRKEITAVLKDADLSTMSAKKVRQQIEEKLSIDLTSRKKEVDDIVMNCLKEQGKKGEKKKNGSKKKDDDDEDDDEEGEDDDEEEEEEEDDDDEEDDDKPAKRAANKKPVAVKRKNSSDESEDDDDKESDEEYSPSKKSKGRPKGKGAGKGRKKKGSDSDSDEDWGKGKKASGGAKKGGGAKKAGGYTKVCTLSPELAAVVGQDSMARHEVVKKVWAIIKEKNLYDPKNKQYAICNDELLKVFGVKRFRTFGMMKFLKNHFVD